MLELAATYADAWNWWTWDETIEEITGRIKPLIEQLDAACSAKGRDSTTLERTLDVYTVLAPGSEADGGLAMRQTIAGSAEGITAQIGALGSLGFNEVRCDVYPKTPDAIEAMAPVVELVHRL